MRIRDIKKKMLKEGWKFEGTVSNTMCTKLYVFTREDFFIQIYGRRNQCAMIGILPVDPNHGMSNFCNIKCDVERAILTATLRNAFILATLDYTIQMDLKYHKERVEEIEKVSNPKIRSLIGNYVQRTKQEEDR